MVLQGSLIPGKFELKINRSIKRRDRNMMELNVPFLLGKNGSSSQVTQLRQFVCCDWSWHSIGSLIPGKFELKINRSVKICWGCMLLLISSCSGRFVVEGYDICRVREQAGRRAANSGYINRK